MTRPIRLLAAAFCLLPTASFFLHAASPPELTILRTQYEKAVTERVTAPYDAGLTELNARFSTALDRLAGEAKKEGKLDEVLAIQDDQKRLAGKLPIPDDDDSTPGALKPMRTIYREQSKKLEDLRAANHAALLPDYAAKLQALEVTLTKADRVDEAKEVRDHRTSLMAGFTAPANAIVATPDAGTTPAPEITAPSGKGDDRAAAEFVLSIGGRVKISGFIDLITDAAALPKGRFTLIEINLGAGLKRQLEEADADKLMNLDALTAVVLNRAIKADEALRFLATCPNLIGVRVENCPSLTGSWLQYAAPLENLITLVALETASRDLSALAAFQSRGLTFAHLRTTATDDDTLAALSRFEKLTTLRLRNTKVTDAGMAHLAGLKDLVCVDVSETLVTLAGIKALAGIPLTELGFGMSPDDLAAAATELGVLFPDVVDFQYPPRGITGASHLAALGRAWPKLRRLEFPSNHKLDPDSFLSAGPLFPALDYLYLWNCPVTDEHVAGIAQLKKLTNLDLSSSQVTDACLSELQKMKSLEYVQVSNTKITPPAIAAFKKQRPDVSVTQ